MHMLVETLAVNRISGVGGYLYVERYRGGQRSETTWSHRIQLRSEFGVSQVMTRQKLKQWEDY